MRNRTLVLSFVLLIATAGAAFAQEKKIHKSVPLDPGGQLSIDSHNGSITVTTWNRPTVEIDARIVATGDATADDLAATDVKISGSGNRVSVETDYASLAAHFFGMNYSQPPVHFTISMPATASLRISTHDARVDVRGLHADLHVDDHNGPVHVDAHEGAVDIETHNGSVDVVFARFNKQSSVETHNGSIEIRMPAAAGFRIDADGHRLGFDSDFPVVMKGVDRDHIAGNINGGGPALRLSTHNGSVRLHKS